MEVFMPVSRLRLFLKQISKSCAADDVLSVGPQFLPQAGDADIDGTVGDDDTRPDTVHQLLS